MKLYNGDRVMQMVDKDQVETCLEAGWSRTKPEEKVDVDELKRQKEEADKALLEAQEAEAAELAKVKEAEEAAKAEKKSAAPKKITVPKKK